MIKYLINLLRPSKKEEEFKLVRDNRQYLSCTDGNYIIGKLYIQFTPTQKDDSILHSGIEICVDLIRNKIVYETISAVGLNFNIQFDLVIENENELILYTDKPVETVFITFDQLKTMMNP